jgi:glutathione S-transferase
MRRRKQERVDFEKWIFWLVSTLGPMTGQVNSYRHHNGRENADALKRYVGQVDRCYGVLEEQLEKAASGYVLERGCSCVDVQFYPRVKEFEYTGFEFGEVSAHVGVDWGDGEQERSHGCI